MSIMMTFEDDEIAPPDNALLEYKKKIYFDKYFREHLNKGATHYEAALLAYDDVKSDIKNGRIK